MNITGFSPIGPGAVNYQSEQMLKDRSKGKMTGGNELSEC